MSETPVYEYKPAVLVAYEKHVTRFLDATTLEAWARSSLILLTERMDEKYGYYRDPDVEPSAFELEMDAKDDTYLAVSEETLRGLPEDSADTIRKRQAYVRRSRAEEKAYKEWYVKAREVVANQDLTILYNKLGRPRPLAYQLLYERSNDGYERVELEELE